MTSEHPVILMRGGGDLASGVALRLHRVGLKLVITELAQPLTVRRLVSFSSAVFEKQVAVEGVVAQLVDFVDEALRVLQRDQIPVLVDPDCEVRLAPELDLLAIIDARMTKKPPDLGMEAAPLVIGLGPGFNAGVNCHAVIETNRGHTLGRVIWDGEPQADTGLPGKVSTFRAERVLRAPVEGVIQDGLELGLRVSRDQIIATVAGRPVQAPFDGILRGLLHDGLPVHQGMKIGDVDPRDDPSYARLVSEKSLAIGGGVLEALLSQPEMRQALWS
jgi:xanthine dehydrogenase accessory factor